MTNVKTRLGALILALIMCFSMLAACSKDDDSSDETDGKEKTTATADGTSAKEDPDEDEDKDEDIDVLESAEDDPIGTFLNGSADYVTGIADSAGAPALPKLDSDVNTYTVGFGVPDVGDFSLDAAVDSSNGNFSGNLALEVQGVKADASIWGDGDNLALKVPFLLGDDAYGIKFSTLLEDLENSTLLDSLGIDYDDLMKAFEEGFKEGSGGMSLDEAMGMMDPERIGNATEDFTEKLAAIYEDLEANVTEETISVNGNDVDAVAIEYTITPDDVIAFVEAYFEYIEAVAGDYATEMADMDFEDILDEMKESAAEETENATVKIYLDEKTGVLTAVKFIADEEANRTITLYFTAAEDKLDVDIVFEITDGDDIQTMSLTIDEVSDSGKDGFVVELTSTSDNESIIISFVRDTSDGEYEFNVTVSDITVLNATGTLTYDDDSFEFTVDSITAEGETIELNLLIAVKAGGEVDDMPKYKNILMMSEDDLTEIVGNLQGIMG